MRFFFGTAFLGLAAAFLAHGLGIPWWNGQWPPGDATDIGVCVQAGVFYLAWPSRARSREAATTPATPSG